MSTLTPISINVKYYIIKHMDNEKLLGVTVDANFKASKIVHVLARITP